MAEGLSVQESLKLDLTCKICWELMHEPKTLPCTHVYCKQCLQKLASHSQATSDSAAPQCPECHQDIPNSNIDDLPTDFRIARLKGVYDTVLQINQGAGTTTELNLTSCNLHGRQTALYCITCRDVFCQDCEKSHVNHNCGCLIDDSKATFKPKFNDSKTSASNITAPSCKKHQNRELVVYCETCNEMLCQLCIADKHEGHHYTKIQQAAEEQRRRLKEVSASVTDLEPQLSTALISGMQVKATIAAQARERELQVERAFEFFFSTLREQKELIQRQIAEEVQQKNEALGQQKEELTSVYSDLVEAAAEDNPENLSNEEILLHTEEKVIQLNQLRERIQRLPLKPAVTADIGASILPADLIKTCCKKCQFRYRIPDMSRCQLTGEFLRAPETDKVHLITLQLLDSRGENCPGHHKIEATLRRIRDRSQTPGRVQKLPASDGAYSITFDSVERGRHEFSVFVNDTILPQCPIALFIRKPPEKITAPVRTIPNPNEPAALLFHNGNMLVFEKYPYNTVSVYNKKGEKTCTMIPGGEVSVDRATNTYYVSDRSAYPPLHKFNENGERLQSEGQIGKRPGQLLSSNGLDFHNGELYVTDSGNHWIHVYDRDLNFLRQFGRNGAGNGCFKTPQDVTADEDGTLYITDCFNYRVQVMSPTGQFIRSIQKSGVMDRCPHTPVSVRIHMGLLYITEYNRFVSVFTKSGNFVARFGAPYIEHPEGIAIDEDGYIYVTSHRKQIVVF